ncbi:MAG TPA: hypothetical protein VGM37_20410 [Armatimonadota bacterium]
MLPHEQTTPPGWTLLERRVIAAIAPYRLDLTVAVLRRTADNLVDVWTEGGVYLRAVTHRDGPLVYAVTQAPGANELVVSLYAPATSRAKAPHPSFASLDVAMTLGVSIDLRGFYDAAREIPLLWPVAERARGVKPPRYPSLWEAVCNAVVFQQISLEAATAVMRRIVSGLSSAVWFGDVALHPFPALEALLAADPAALRGWGLSASKARSLRDAADAILAGRLTDAEIEKMPTGEALARLTRERGIGHWTASVILLRGFRRLDVFPMADSGARRGLRGLLGEGYSGDDPDAAHLLDVLGPWRGMLYYHLLLLRLAKNEQVDLDRG